MTHTVPGQGFDEDGEGAVASGEEPGPTDDPHLRPEFFNNRLLLLRFII